MDATGINCRDLGSESAPIHLNKQLSPNLNLTYQDDVTARWRILQIKRKIKQTGS